MIATHFSPLFLLALPSGGDHRHSLDEIFEYKLPKLKEGDSDKYLIGAELIVLLKWLPSRTSMSSRADRFTRSFIRSGGGQFALPRRQCAGS
jgi:hypothetical protein